MGLIIILHGILITKYQQTLAFVQLLKDIITGFTLLLEVTQFLVDSCIRLQWLEQYCMFSLNLFCNINNLNIHKLVAFN